MSNFIPYQPNFDNFFYSTTGEVGRYLAKRGFRVRRAAKKQVGFRTGALRSSIHMRHYRDSRGQFIEVGSKLSYARMHHEGTKPHTILPNKRRVLRFFSKGFMVYTLAVNHPGTRPNRYLSDNLILVLR